MFITTADFNVGKYELSTGIYDLPKLQSYIDKYEKKYLVQLLGVDLYADFIANQLLPKYVKIFDPLEEDHDFCIIWSDGMTEMLKGFIYFEYGKDLINQMTPAGNVQPVGENSNVVSTLYSMIYARYNEGVGTYRAIQHYVVLNRSDYSEFNGIGKEMAYWL